jgi:hypothetical protein
MCVSDVYIGTMSTVNRTANSKQPNAAGVVNSFTGAVYIPMTDATDYADMSDEVLLAKIAAKDRLALGALYDRYGRRVFALSARMLNDPQSSEEVTQDVFMSVWRRVTSYKPGRCKFTTWLFSIAHNRTIDELRKRMRDRSRDNQNIDDHINIKEETALAVEQVIAQSKF